MTSPRISPLSGVAGVLVDAVMLMTFTIFVALAHTLQLTPKTADLTTGGHRAETPAPQRFDATVTVNPQGLWLDRAAVPGGLVDLPGLLARFQESDGLIGLCMRFDKIGTAEFWRIHNAVSAAAGRSVVHICAD